MSESERGSMGIEKALGLPGLLQPAGLLITTSIGGNGAPRLPSFTQKQPCNLGFPTNGSLLGSDRGLLGRRADGLSGQTEASKQSNAGGEEEEALHGNNGWAAIMLTLRLASRHRSPVLALEIPQLLQRHGRRAVSK